MKDEKMRGLMIEMKERKWNIVYMYGVFIVECISLSLLTTKYVYLKFLFISVQKKLKLLFFKSSFRFIYTFFETRVTVTGCYESPYGTLTHEQRYPKYFTVLRFFRRNDNFLS